MPKKLSKNLKSRAANRKSVRRIQSSPQGSPRGRGTPNTGSNREPLPVFCSYSHKDEDLRRDLGKHLSALERQGLIATWYYRLIPSGAVWAKEIDHNLESAEIILLLVSKQFLASTYCMDVEMQRAMERHERFEAAVIPVILEHCDWHGTPFAKLQVLPTGGKPITEWRDRQEAFKNVARGIREVAVGSEGSSRRFWGTVLEGYNSKDLIYVVFTSKWGIEWVDGDRTGKYAHTPQLTYNEVSSFQELQTNLLSPLADRFRLVHGGVRRPGIRGLIGPDFDLDGTLIVIGSTHANPICRRILLEEYPQFPFQFRTTLPAGSKRSSQNKCITVHRDASGRWFEEPLGRAFVAQKTTSRAAPGVARDIKVDYGIVARIANPFDGLGHHKALILGGCHGFGTEAAVRFVGNKELLDSLQRKVGRNDFAALIRSAVEGRRAQTPRVEILSIREGNKWPTTQWSGS